MEQVKNCSIEARAKQFRVEVERKSKGNPKRLDAEKSGGGIRAVP